jgi:predicted Zn-dependent peptidase
MKKIILSLTALFICFSVKAQVDRTNAPEPNRPEKLDVGVLIPIKMDNGMQVYLAPVKKYPKFTLTLNIEQPGFKEDERQEEKGILLKAYYAKLSKKYPGGEIDSLVNLKGAMLNATTTGGTIKGMNRDIESLLDMYTDLLFQPVVKEEYIKTEAEEYEKSQENKDPSASVYGKDEFNPENLIDSLLHGSSAKKEINKKIALNYDSIGIEEVEDFVDKRIASNNAVAVLIGDFTPKEARRLMQKYFGDWQPGKSYSRERQIKSDKAIIKNRKIYVIDKPNNVQSRINVNWILGDAYPHDENSVKVEVLNEILGESQLSYLYKNIREDKGLCYFVRSSLTPDDNGGRATIWTTVRTDQTAYTLENIILEMLRIRNFDVSDEDLKIAKSSLIGEFTRSLSGIAPIPYMSFAMTKDFYNLPDDYLQTRVSKYYEVTKEDVREMAKKYVNPFECLVIVNGKASELRGKLEKFGDVTYLDEKGNELTFKR